MRVANSMRERFVKNLKKSNEKNIYVIFEEKINYIQN